MLIDMSATFSTQSYCMAAGAVITVGCIGVG
jgi:hypothetical protein